MGSADFRRANSRSCRRMWMVGTLGWWRRLFSQVLLLLLVVVTSRIVTETQSPPVLVVEAAAAAASRLGLVRHALQFGQGKDSNNNNNSTAAVRPQDKKQGELSSSKEIKFLQQQQHHYQPTILERLRLRGGASSHSTLVVSPSSSSSSPRLSDCEESRSAASMRKKKFGRRGRHLILAYSSAGRTATRRSILPSSLVRPRSALPPIIIRGSVSSTTLTTCSRGGALADTMPLLPVQINTETTSSSNMALQKSKTPIKRTLRTAIICTLIYTLIQQRHVWMPVLTNKQVLQDTTLSVLHRLTPSPHDPPADWFRAYLLYGCGMALWEFCGLSTIPVETAAGMVLGWPAAAVASFTGKFGGACTAYAVGRHARDWVRQNVPALQQSTLLQLLLTSNNDNDNNDKSEAASTTPPPHPPLLTAFLMKFSCFPELVKNVGSSLIPAVKPWMFALVTLLHGGMFTLLWTWLGVDTAARLETTNSVVPPSNCALQATVGATLILGIFVTPVVMVWWMRDLQRQSQQQSQQQQQQDRASWAGRWRQRIRWSPSKNNPLVAPPPSPDPSASSWTQPLQTTLRQWNHQVRAYLRDTTLTELCLVAGLVCALLVRGTSTATTGTSV